MYTRSVKPAVVKVEVESNVTAKTATHVDSGYMQ